MPFEYVPAGFGTATQTSESRHDRAALLVAGVIALGIGYWWWKHRTSAFFVENEGYYNLPEPETPRRPSGL